MRLINQNDFNEMQEKVESTKCFAAPKGRCTALKKKNCAGCSFYKTISQNEEDLKKYGWLDGEGFKKGTEIAVVCVDDGKIFNNYCVAGEYYSMVEASYRNIGRCCDGASKYVQNKRFRWATISESRSDKVIV